MELRPGRIANYGFNTYAQLAGRTIAPNNLLKNHAISLADEILSA
jgi:hypothetical protein